MDTKSLQNLAVRTSSETRTVVDRHAIPSPPAPTTRPLEGWTSMAATDLHRSPFTAAGWTACAAAAAAAAAVFHHQQPSAVHGGVHLEPIPKGRVSFQAAPPPASSPTVVHKFHTTRFSLDSAAASVPLSPMASSDGMNSLSTPMEAPPLSTPLPPSCQSYHILHHHPAGGMTADPPRDPFEELPGHQWRVLLETCPVLTSGVVQHSEEACPRLTPLVAFSAGAGPGYLGGCAGSAMPNSSPVMQVAVSTQRSSMDNRRTVGAAGSGQDRSLTLPRLTH